MSDFLRYGLQWNGPKEFVCTPMEDGYWVPWHEADLTAKELRQRAERAEAENAKLRAALPYDWDKYQASQESLREHMQLLGAVQSTIAELTATVERLRGYLKRALHEADGWFDECRGTSANNPHAPCMEDIRAALGDP